MHVQRLPALSVADSPGRHIRCASCAAQISHLAPTALGMAVLCTAKLAKVEARAEEGGGHNDLAGTRLTFSLSAVDSSQQQVATGTHTRVLARA